MEVRNDGAGVFGEGRREAAVFHIRPLKLAAKSAPATLQHCTDPKVRIFVIPPSWDSTIHATSGRLAVGSRFMSEIRSAAKTSRQTRMANLNSGGGAAGAPPSLPPLPSTPSERSTTVHNLVLPSLTPSLPFLLSAILSSALVSEHVAPT